MDKVTVVVVTYNRKELLKECLNAIMSQSYPVETVLVINNKSTDGTEELFSKGKEFDQNNIHLITLESNMGGAGGFSLGMEKALQTDCDYIWIMDDDTIPDDDALKELVNANSILSSNGVQAGYLASTVFGAHGEAMNVPVISRNPSENGYVDWYRFLGDGMVRLRHATFVSLLFPSDAVEKVGFPIGDYFIWGDDTEYTQRLGRFYGEGFFVGKSHVIHKRFNAKKIDILNEENNQRIPIYKYYYRNSLITAKFYNPKGNAQLHVLEFWIISLKCLLLPGIKYRWNKFLAIHRGVIEYFVLSGKYVKQIKQSIKALNG